VYDPSIMRPRVSVGMPVYNGERYVKEALDSLLAQTFSDFELVIADNASTDGTEEICLSVAERDRRVRYIRNRANYGAIHNFNNLFSLTTGAYFKWAAYDDVCEPEFLSRCVAVLDQDASVVLACPRVAGIDENGHPTDLVTRPGHGKEFASGIGLDIDPDVSPADVDPTQRWRFMMRYLWWVPHLYGLIRADALARTKLHPLHFNGDQMLLAELALLGRFHEIPEELLYIRLHTQRTSRTTGAVQRLAVAHPGLPQSRTWPTLRAALAYPERFLFHAGSIHRAPLTKSQRTACYNELLATVVRWARMRTGSLIR
jgi:glycosyltransferase involved in cell wall biosynthesis